MKLQVFRLFEREKIISLFVGRSGKEIITNWQQTFSLPVKVFCAVVVNYVTFVASVADPDPLLVRLPDPTPALKKDQPKVREN